MMIKQITKIGAAATIAAVSATVAHAGGFALKEGSTAAQGASFAGATSGDGDITYTFFNPAALRAVDGIQLAFSNSFIAPTGEVIVGGQTFDGGQDAFLGAFYVGARINEQLVVGATVNAPFGLATEYNKGWIGQFEALRTDLKTFAFTPMVSYDVAPNFTIGAGFTVLYGELTLENRTLVGLTAAGAPVTANQEVLLDGFAYGFHIGALWDVTPRITLGAAFKSGYGFTGDGEIEFRANPGAVFPVAFPAGPSTIEATDAEGDLPPVISLGGRFQVTDKWTGMAEVQWQGWSSLDVFTVETAAGSDEEEFSYEDAFYVAAGAEYAYAPEPDAAFGHRA